MFPDYHVNKIYYGDIASILLIILEIGNNFYFENQLKLYHEIIEILLTWMNEKIYILNESNSKIERQKNQNENKSLNSKNILTESQISLIQVQVQAQTQDEKSVDEYNLNSTRFSKILNSKFFILYYLVYLEVKQKVFLKIQANYCVFCLQILNLLLHIWLKLKCF